MKTFKSKWDGRAVEDDGAYMSKEAKSFVTAFRNMLKRELKNLDAVIDIKAGHYFLSGFITVGDKVCYVNYDIPRWGERIDVTGLINGEKVLYREAKNTSDYTGGANRYCYISELPRSLRTFFS